MSYSQVFYQQSFEELTGYSLSHTFDDGNNDFVKRDSAAAFPGLEFDLVGEDGFFVVGVEDTDAPEPGAPVDGVVTLDLNEVDISGFSDIELVISLACNAQDMAYDDRTQENGDYLDVQVALNGGDWTTIGSFCSQAGGSSISTLYQDTDMDGNGGEVGEPPLGAIMTDFVIPVPFSGSTLDVRCLIRMNGSDEELIIDDIRLRESEGDDVAPTVNSATLVNQSTIQVVFNEPMGSNAESTFLYAGIPGIQSAVLQPDEQTVILPYDPPFTIGEPYELVIFGIQDQAGNAMAGAFSFPFYFNPTTPELVITEVMYNDPSNVDSLEFIEIYNAGSTEAIVGGFRLEDAVNHTLASITIPPGGFYLVARNALVAENYFGQVFYEYGGQLSDNNEDIVLVNADGVNLDSVSYNDNVPWPTAADGLGPSMELVSPSADNQIGSNWVASIQEISFVNGLILAASPGFLPVPGVPVVQFDNNDLGVLESDGSFGLDFYIAGSNADPIEVALTILEGTADSPGDISLTDDPSLTLPPSSPGLETIIYGLTDDSDNEGLEYVRVQMSAVSNCTIGVNHQIDILIADDDEVPPLLYINEIQSQNISTISDEEAEFDDWVDVYNPNNFDVDLAGYFWSDDSLDPLKDRLGAGDAGTVVPANGYQIFWADGSESEGPTHLDFGLSGAGEEVILTSPTGTITVDAVSFPAIPEDESYGRFCDGETNFLIWGIPTPLQDNCVNSVSEFERRRLNVYPNPTRDVLNLPSMMDYRILDIRGAMVLEGRADRLNVQELPAGLYTIWTMEGSARFFKE